MMLKTYLSQEFSGTFNGAKPGLGKTLETLTVVGVIALAAQCRTHVALNEAEHIVNNEGRCNNPYRFGIECFCIRKSLTRRIYLLSQRRPQLVVAPASIVPQWPRQVEVHSTPNVVLRDGTILMDQPLLRVAIVQDGQVKPVFGLYQDATPTIEYYLPAITLGGALPTAKVLNDRYGKSRGAVGKAETAKAPSRCDYTWTLRGLQDSALGLEVEIPRCNAYDGQERNLLICSSTLLSHGGFDKILCCKTSVDQFESRDRLRATKREIIITRCLIPSFVAYDEWTEAKRPETKLVSVLRDICNAESADRIDRPNVVLLSGTPMPRGPKDLEGVLPLVRVPNPDDPTDRVLTRLKEAYNNAMAIMKDPARVGECQVAKGDFACLMNNCFRGFMFNRSYGMAFLGGSIPDPRTKLLRYDPVFLDTTPRHKEAMEKLESELRLFIAEHYPDHTAAQLQQLERTKLFRRTLLCSVIPSLADVDVAFLDRSEQSDSTLEKDKSQTHWLARNIDMLRCPPLEQLTGIVRRGGPDKLRDGWHGLILTLSPTAAEVCAKWLQHTMGEEAHVVHLTAKVKPRDRAEFAKNIRLEAEAHPSRRCIIISTYQLMSTGIDGLQHFASFLVKLGEPFSPNHHEQSEGRIHRVGQTRPVIVYELHGAVGSIDWEFHMRNSRNTELMGHRGVLTNFLQKSAVLAGNPLNSQNILGSVASHPITLS